MADFSLHRFASPASFLRLANTLLPWGIALGFILTIWGCVSGLLQSPPDYLQGEYVRIMYVHVPTAWLGMAGWIGIAVCSLMQLIWRHPLAGIAASALAVPGAVLTAICLLTGSIWGRPTWGTWWEWDGRMTSMLVLLFLYLGYIALDQAQRNSGRSDRMLAVFGVVGAINIPIIHQSVVWWNTLHQTQSISLTGSKIAPELLWPLLISTLGFNLLFIAIVLLRMKTRLLLNSLAARQMRMARE